LGLQVGGFAAAGPGLAGSITGSGPQDTVYTGGTGGAAGGVGASISGMGTYTWFDQHYSFDNAPAFIRDAFGSLNADCGCGN